MQRFFALFFGALILASCRTAEFAKEQAYRDDGLPVWVENSFTNPSGYWAGYNDEKGYYSWGSAKYADLHASTSAAELDAKVRLTQFVCSERSVKNPAPTVYGMRRVDRFVSKDGTVYVLMFVSERNTKKSFGR